MYRLIIADDEPIECRALEHKIQELVDGVELLPSVYDGASLLRSVEKYHPDIAIVDVNMPGLSGLEAIELLKVKRVELKIIINTAYNDFAYIQKALQLGASDYLLKPGNKLTMAEAVQRVCRRLDQERAERMEREKDRNVVDGLYRVASEKWMLSLLLGKQDEACYQLLAANCPQVEDGGFFAAWRVVTEERKPLPDLKQAMEFLLREMGRFCYCMGVEYEGIIYLFLMQDQRGGAGNETELIDQTAEYGYRKLRERGLDAFVGVSRYKGDKGQYIGGLYEARVSLQEKDRPGIAYFHYREEETRPYILAGLAHSGARLLAEGKVDQCSEMVLQAVRRADPASLADVDALRVQAVVYLLELEREALRLRGDARPAGSVFLLWDHFGEAGGQDEILSWIEEETGKCYRHVFGGGESENPYISRAMIYIYENYERDISLEDTAATIGISSFYLSRLFKQEKQVTFVEVLTDVRIRRAVQLMKENQLSMREICQQTGYSSMTYFYRVFKKTTGFTVGVMRKYLISMV